jgi:hypothetical protein
LAPASSLPQEYLLLFCQMITVPRIPLWVLKHICSDPVLKASPTHMAATCKQEPLYPLALLYVSVLPASDQLTLSALT